MATWLGRVQQTADTKYFIMLQYLDIGTVVDIGTVNDQCKVNSTEDNMNHSTE